MTVSIQRYTASHRPSPSATINLRAPAAQRGSDRRAASFQGKSRTEFMLEAAREKAQHVLLDQTMFVVSPPQYRLSPH